MFLMMIGEIIVRRVGKIEAKGRPHSTNMVFASLAFLGRAAIPVPIS